jgi:hypothetical protein
LARPGWVGEKVAQWRLTTASPHWNFPILPLGEWKKEKKSDGVFAVVHELWVGGVHIGGHGAGGRAGLSPGRVTLALAACGACLGWVRNGRGDFLDQEIRGQTDKSI